MSTIEVPRVIPGRPEIPAVPAIPDIIEIVLMYGCDVPNCTDKPFTEAGLKQHTIERHAISTTAQIGCDSTHDDLIVDSKVYQKFNSLDAFMLIHGTSRTYQNENATDKAKRIGWEGSGWYRVYDVEHEGGRYDRSWTEQHVQYAPGFAQQVRERARALLETANKIDQLTGVSTELTIDFEGYYDSTETTRAIQQRAEAIRSSETATTT